MIEVFTDQGENGRHGPVDTIVGMGAWVMSIMLLCTGIQQLHRVSCGSHHQAQDA